MNAPGTPGAGAPSAPGRVSLRALVLLAWVALYLLLMGLSDWPWRSASAWALGSPAYAELERAGALVPARPHWESFLLSPWLHRSLLGVLLLAWWASGALRQVIAFAGTARTWTLFVAGGAAGAGAHALAHPDSGLPVGAGPFDAIAALIGATLCWGLVSKAPGAKRARNGALVSVLLVAAFTWYGVRAAPDDPEVWKFVGLEAMLGAFAVGFVLMALFGPRRAARPAGPAVRALAGALALAVLAAGVSQGAALLGSADRAGAARMLERLESAEYAAWDLSRNQVHATPEKRDDLARALARLLADDFLDGFEGRDALRAYVEALRAYTQPVRLPWVAEGACRAAFRAWYDEHEAALRESRGLEARMPNRFFWKQP